MAPIAKTKSMNPTLRKLQTKQLTAEMGKPSPQFSNEQVINVQISNKQSPSVSVRSQASSSSKHLPKYDSSQSPTPIKSSLKKHRVPTKLAQIGKAKTMLTS